MIIWINRIITGLTCAIFASLLEHFKVAPAWCFIAGMLNVMLLAFVFEFVRMILGGK